MFRGPFRAPLTFIYCNQMRWIGSRTARTAERIGRLHSTGETEGNETREPGGLTRNLPGITWKPVSLEHHQQTHWVCTTESCGSGVGVSRREHGETALRPRGGEAEGEQSAENDANRRRLAFQK